MGQVFRVETPTGVWAVKKLFHESAAGPLETQASFIEAASNAGIGTPRVMRSDAGEIVSVVSDVPWRVFEWTDILGKPTLQEAEGVLARLHAVGWPTEEPVDPWYTSRTVGGSWEQLLDRANGQPWARLLRDQLPEIEALEEVAREATLPACRFCHRDFNESNLAVDRAGRIVVLNWDNCGPLPAEREVGSVLADGGRDTWHVESLAGATGFVRAYREAGGVFAPTSLDVFANGHRRAPQFSGRDDRCHASWRSLGRGSGCRNAGVALRIAYLEKVLDAIR